MPCEEKVKKSFYDTLKKLSRTANDSSSGIGMLLYQTGEFPQKYHSDLRPSFPCPKNVSLKDDRSVEVLLDITSNRSPLHDGFIFFNERGELTHISQYLAPLIIVDVLPNEAYGTRHYSAKLGSFLEGVILTGVICNDRKPYVFQKGRCVIY